MNSITLPQLKIEFPADKAGEELLLVAGGREPDGEWLRAAARGRRVFAADRGLEYCLRAGVLPEFALGDWDSINPDCRYLAEQEGIRTETFPREKDATDLQLLLTKLPATGGSIVVTGVWGGRFDHLFANVYSLLPLAAHNRVVLADEQECMIILDNSEFGNRKSELSQSEKQSLHSAFRIPNSELNPSTKLSLLPLSPRCVVSIDGVKWPLDHAELTQDFPYAVSNEPTIKYNAEIGMRKSELSQGEKSSPHSAFRTPNSELLTEITCHSGRVGVYLYYA